MPAPDDSPHQSGGVGENNYGVAASRTERADHAAVKSWFCFDHSVVSLGAGLTITGSNRPAFTLINLCRLHGPVTAVADLAKPRTLAASAMAHNLPTTRRIVHDGITYHFARPSKVSLEFGRPTGSETGQFTPGVERFSLAFNHGLNPSNETYAYIVLPFGDDPAAKAKADEEVAQLEILANTPALQAVRHRTLALIGAVFWQAGVGDVARWRTHRGQPTLHHARPRPEGQPAREHRQSPHGPDHCTRRVRG